MLIPPKGGPIPHSHVTFQEAFYIIDGEITVITKEKKLHCYKRLIRKYPLQSNG